MLRFALLTSAACALCLVAPARALAQDSTESSSSTEAPAAEAPSRRSGPLPRDSHWQLFVDAPPIATQNIAAGFYQPHGLGVNIGSAGGAGFSQIGVGLNAGLGYLASDLLEFGGGIGIDVGNTSAGLLSGTAYQVLLEPLIKLNLGSTFKWGEHLNPFVFGGLPLGFSGTSLSSGVLFGAELAAGLEWLFRDHVGLSVFVPLDIVGQGGPVSTFLFSFGLQYGITIYL